MYLAFHPTQVDHNEAGDVVFPEPTTWSDEERAQLFEGLLCALNDAMQTLRSQPEGSEEQDVLTLADAVLDEQDAAVVVTLGRIPTKKAEDVRGLLDGFVGLQEAHIKATGEIAPIASAAEPPRQRTNPGRRVSARFPTPAETRWEEVRFAFVSDDSARITVGRVSKIYTFAELGFKDGRKGDRPDTRWAILRKLASQGEVSRKAGKVVPQAKAAMKDIRKRLIEVTGINSDPFHPYLEHHAYRPKFLLSDKTYS